MTTLRTHDGLDLQGIDALPAGPARAALLLVHGLGEHVGRYAALIERLVADGLAVHAWDQRGHGRSPGARGAIPDDAAPMRDLAAMVDAVRARHPGRPLVLLGHSMGGAEAARFVAEVGLYHAMATLRSEAENLLARCIQHENDHLNGVTIMDRATHFYEDDYPEDTED